MTQRARHRAQPSRRRRFAYRIAVVTSLAAVIIGASVLIAGQVGDDGEQTDPAANPRQSTQVDVEINPGTGSDEFVGARADVSDEECRRVEGGWRSAGSVTNPTSEPVSYRIYTSFMTLDGDTAALVQTNVIGVGPGETMPWETAVSSQADAMPCVLRVERIAADAAQAPAIDADDANAEDDDADDDDGDADD